MSECGTIVCLSSSQNGQSVLALEHFSFDNITTLSETVKNLGFIRWRAGGTLRSGV